MTTGTVLALGLMSGTSADGIDAALIETDGRSRFQHIAFHEQPYSDAFTRRLRDTLGRTTPDTEMRTVERDFTDLNAKAVATVLEKAGISYAQVAVVGFHGHTVHHDPAHAKTLQIGDGARLAAACGIDVVGDFRSADMAAGGEGAPLAPVFHRVLAAGMALPLAVLNIGGVANLTWIGEDETLVAFDTGPGNALLDDWVFQQTGARFDENGQLADRGRSDEAALAALMASAYFERPPPKSLDRNAFDISPVTRLDAATGAATLVQFTAAAIARSLDHLPAPPRQWLVTGGGRRNPALMARLREALNTSIEPVETVGWNGDALEAQAFGFLAARHLEGLPISFPETTGATHPIIGGVRFPAAGQDVQERGV